MILKIQRTHFSSARSTWPLLLCGVATTFVSSPATAQTAATPQTTLEAGPPSPTAGATAPNEAPVTSTASAASAAPIASAKSPSVAKPAPPPFAPIKIGSSTLSIYNRTRIESWDFFQGRAGAGGNAGDGRYNFVGNLLRVGILNAKPRRDLQFEIAQPSVFNLPSDAIASGPGTAGQGLLGLGANYFQSNQKTNDAGIFVKQAFVRFKRAPSGDALRLGRFEWSDGAETTPKDAILAWLKRERIASRLFANFGFSHAQRSFDGGQLSLGGLKNNFTLTALRPTGGVFHMDGNGELSDIDVLYGAYTRPGATSDARVFASLYRDGRGADVVKVDNRPLAVRVADRQDIAITTLGAHYLRDFEAGSGKADVLFWGALQGGDWGTQSHRASAFALEAGYQPSGSRLKPWLRAGYFKGSGDNNASDDRHQTFFTHLNTPRQYARFPFYNMMNNEDTFAQLILRPNKNTTFRVEAHALRLASAGDLFYAGGGAFQNCNFGFNGRPSGGQSDLANVYDISLDRQLSAHTSLSLYLAMARGGGVIQNIFREDSNGRFGFIEVTNRF